MPAWQARRVAQQTHALPLAGARWVDHRLAARTDGCPRPGHHRPAGRPGDRQVRPRSPRAARRPTPRPPPTSRSATPTPPLYAGTSDLAATGDTLTLQSVLRPALRHRPPALARRRHRPPRRPQDQSHRPDHRPRHRTSRPRRRHRPRSVLGSRRHQAGSGKIRLYVLVDADDLDVDAEGGAAFAVGTVERLGAATMAKLRQWVGHHQVVIQPVLNMARRDAVDSPRPTRVDARARRAPRRPLRLPPLHRPRQELRQGPHRPPTSRSTKADHPDKPTPTPSPACAGGTTAPKPPASGGTPARPKATTSGTAPTAPPTSSPTPAPTASDHETSKPRPWAGCSNVGFTDTVPLRANSGSVHQARKCVRSHDLGCSRRRRTGDSVGRVAPVRDRRPGMPEREAHRVVLRGPAEGDGIILPNGSPAARIIRKASRTETGGHWALGEAWQDPGRRQPAPHPRRSGKPSMSLEGPYTFYTAIRLRPTASGQAPSSSSRPAPSTASAPDQKAGDSSASGLRPSKPRSSGSHACAQRRIAHTSAERTCTKQGQARSELLVVGFRRHRAAAHEQPARRVLTTRWTWRSGGLPRPVVATGRGRRCCASRLHGHRA